MGNSFEEGRKFASQECKKKKEKKLKFSLQ